MWVIDKADVKGMAERFLNQLGECAFFRRDQGTFDHQAGFDLPQAALGELILDDRRNFTVTIKPD